MNNNFYFYCLKAARLVEEKSLVGYGECSALTQEGLKNVFDVVLNVVFVLKNHKNPGYMKKSKCAKGGCLIF